MESRVLVLFLGLTLGVGGLTGCARDRLVQAEDTTQPPVIEPDVERREIEVPKIDTEDFEVGILAGQISVEDFGVNTVAGGRFAYHVTEGFFVEESWADLRQIVGAAARSNVRVYSLDARGLDARQTNDLRQLNVMDAGGGMPLEAYNAAEDGPHMLAVDTGGYPIRRTNQNSTRCCCQ